MDTVAETPYQESGRIFAEPERPDAYRSRNVLLDDLDPTALATIPKLAGPEAPAMCIVGIRHLGGALATPPALPNALGRRDAQYALTVLTPGKKDPADLHTAVLAPWKDRVVGRLLNFSFAPLTPAEVAQAFTPADLTRLRALRTQYDPDGLLRPNHAL